MVFIEGNKTSIFGKREFDFKIKHELKLLLKFKTTVKPLNSGSGQNCPLFGGVYFSEIPHKHVIKNS